MGKNTETDGVFAIKIQHILKTDRIKSYKNELWRELDLYKYINSLELSEQKFFTKLYNYEFINNCKHKQKRTFKVDFSNISNEYAQQLKALDSSTWCVGFILEYKQGTTIAEFLNKQFLHKTITSLTHKQVYSILLQIVNIILILYRGGYYHRDLNIFNLMISETRDNTYNCNGLQVPYYGYQVSAIDYGMVEHRKFKTGKLKKSSEFYLLDEILFGLTEILTLGNVRMETCKKDPISIHYWDSIRIIMIHHPTFYKEIIQRYGTPDGVRDIRKLYIDRFSYKTNKPIENLFPPNHDLTALYQLTLKMVPEFALRFPKQEMKYFGWCKERRFILPKNQSLALIRCTSPAQIVYFLINQLITPI